MARAQLDSEPSEWQQLLSQWETPAIVQLPVIWNNAEQNNSEPTAIVLTFTEVNSPKYKTAERVEPKSMPCGSFTGFFYGRVYLIKRSTS